MEIASPIMLQEVAVHDESGAPGRRKVMIYQKHTDGKSELDHQIQNIFSQPTSQASSPGMVTSASTPFTRTSSRTACSDGTCHSAPEGSGKDKTVSADMKNIL